MCIEIEITAAEFKAKCLALLDRVHDEGEPVTITKRGRVVAQLIPAGEIERRPWLRLRKSARWHGDPLAPAIDEAEVEAQARIQADQTQQNLVQTREQLAMKTQASIAQAAAKPAPGKGGARS